MTETSPITPPPELVRQWSLESQDEHQPTVAYSMVGLLAAKAARWGADQELEACCEVLTDECFVGQATLLREWRRPKPPSLKEQALEAQQRMWHGTSNHDDWNLIRRALEALDD